MPDTITAYYTFVPGTSARSSEVNANFNNHRGNLLPVSSDTATASDNTHDLGSSEHSWQSGYFGTALVVGNTTVAGPLGITRNELSSVGHQVSDSSGLWGTAGASGLNTYDVTMLSINLSTTGRPVFLGLIGVQENTSYIGGAVNDTTSGYQCDLQFKRGGSSSATVTYVMVSHVQESAATQTVQQLNIPPSCFSYIDIPGVGTHTYSIKVTPLNGCSIYLNYVRLIGYEIA